MRILKFKVSGQTISLDSNCDFTGLVPGTNGYLKAEFMFSPEWESYTKVAAFYSNLGREYTPQLIKSDNTCMIPAEALEKSIFKVQVLGQHNERKICTNKVGVYQRRG